MAINKKQINFKKKADYLNEKEAGNILDHSVIYIDDAKEIVTHNTVFDGNIPDWNAEEGQAGFIKNKPENISDTYTKEEIDNAIANISQGSSGDNYETFELRYENQTFLDGYNDSDNNKVFELVEYITSGEHNKVRLIINNLQLDDFTTNIDTILTIEHSIVYYDDMYAVNGYNYDYNYKIISKISFSIYGGGFGGSVYITPVINFNDYIDKNSGEGLSVDKLNTKLLTNENLNDIKDDFSAYYATNFTGTNKPSTISYAFGLICMRTFSNNFKQIITDATSDNSCVRYFRNATSAWSAWKKLLMEDNIQLVSAIPANPDSNTLYCIPEEG